MIGHIGVIHLRSPALATLALCSGWVCIVGEWPVGDRLRQASESREEETEKEGDAALLFIHAVLFV